MPSKNEFGYLCHLRHRKHEDWYRIIVSSIEIEFDMIKYLLKTDSANFNQKIPLQ